MAPNNHLTCQMLGLTLPCPNLTGTTIIIIPIYSVLARIIKKYCSQLLKILNKCTSDKKMNKNFPPKNPSPPSCVKTNFQKAYRAFHLSFAERSTFSTSGSPRTLESRVRVNCNQSKLFHVIARRGSCAENVGFIITFLKANWYYINISWTFSKDQFFQL